MWALDAIADLLLLPQICGEREARVFRVYTGNGISLILTGETLFLLAHKTRRNAHASLIHLPKARGSGGERGGVGRAVLMAGLSMSAVSEASTHALLSTHYLPQSGKLAYPPARPSGELS